MTGPSHIPLERSATLGEAEASIRRALLESGLSAQIDVAGNHVRAARCVLLDSGTPVATGFGKGEPTACRVGSLFEAAEHLYGRHSHIGSDRIAYLEAQDFCHQTRFADGLPLALLHDSPEARLPFLRYREIGGTGQHFLPLALSSPGYLDAIEADPDLRGEDTFDYTRFEHYSSNSGVAIGVNRTEAAIHGLLESLERDALSRFMVQAFVLRDPESIRIIDRGSLPTKLATLAHNVEEEVGNPLEILELKNRANVPTFCAWLEQKSFRLGVAGYGCSLSVGHAVGRSLYELAQCHLIGTEFHGRAWLKACDTQVFSQLRTLPLHQACAEFDLRAQCNEIGFKLVSYADLQAPDYTTSAEGYLGHLVRSIRAAGQLPLVADLTTIGQDQISVSHSFTTNEDRFFNVRHGKPIFPQSLLESGQQAPC